MNAGIYRDLLLTITDVNRDTTVSKEDVIENGTYHAAFDFDEKSRSKTEYK